MRCAVLGRPIAHSLSPVMHRTAYRALGLEEWEYDAIEVGPGMIPRLLSGLDETWRGLSVTAPLKHEAAGLADRRDAYVERTDVANTLLLGEELSAFNTDIPGAVEALAERDIEELGSVVIVGAGATARSMAEAALDLGCASITIVVRRIEAGAALAEALAGRGAELAVVRIGDRVAETDLLVSTVPDEAVDHAIEPLLDGARCVFDVVYDPWPTNLAATAVSEGLPVVSGLDLLAHQAALQVRLMTGLDVAAEMLRDAAVAALASRP